MDEENKRETRQRSRSKTPLTLRSSVDRDVDTDADKKKVKKNPNVDTINEESPAPITTQRSTRPKRNATKIANENANETNNTNNAQKETVALIANSVAAVPVALTIGEQIISKSSSTTTTTTTTIKSTKTNNGEQLTNEKQSSIKSSTASSRSTREINQNESNLLLEHNAKLKTSTPRANKEANLNFTDISVTNGNKFDDHIAFKEYKEAGEYWNKYPKTDYTYSKLSQHRREIKPGVIAMPNMSRRSLENHHERVNLMIKRKPEQESFFRSRYEALTTLRNRAVDSYYDSQDETDRSFNLNDSRSFAIGSRSILRRWITVITTFFSSIFYSVTNIFGGKKTKTIYYTRHANLQKGLIRQCWESVLNVFLAIFRYIYLGISTILLWDSWTLQSNGQTSSKKKTFLIGLIILLPLLFFGGAYYFFENPDSNLNIFFEQIIDQQTIDEFKRSSIQMYMNMVNVSSDYMHSFKMTVYNVANEANKLWSENFSQ